MNTLINFQFLDNIEKGMREAYVYYVFVPAAFFLLINYLKVRAKARRRKEHAHRQGDVASVPLSSIPVRARRPLTPFEEQMFGTLTTALPECVVLAQVAFSALITTDEQAHRNRFDRKVADFVICSRQLTPIAVVELDDRSHWNKRAADADRDTMLRNAGYHTLRYQGIPQTEDVRRDIEALLVALTVPPPAPELHYI